MCCSSADYILEVLVVIYCKYWYSYPELFHRQDYKCSCSRWNWPSRRLEITWGRARTGGQHTFSFVACSRDPPWHPVWINDWSWAAIDLTIRSSGLAIRSPLLASTLAASLFFIILSFIVTSCVLPSMFPFPVDHAKDEDRLNEQETKPQITELPSAEHTRPRSGSTALRVRRSKLSRRRSSGSRKVSWRHYDYFSIKWIIFYLGHVQSERGRGRGTRYRHAFLDRCYSRSPWSELTWKPCCSEG